METQKTPNSQSNLEKEEWNWRIKLPDFQLYYKATVVKSIVQVQRQKYRSVEQNRMSRDKSMDTLSLIKEVKIYNGEKIVSSTCGPGKTGQLRVKE